MERIPMARDTDTSDASEPPTPLRLYPSDFTAPSLSAPFKVDEGYSDDTRSQPDKELLRAPLDDVMPIPDWVLAHSEAERAEIAYGLLRTLRTSTVAALVEKLTPLLHMDPVLKLPPEITSEIFSYLDPQTLLTASLASRGWQSRVSDSRLWKELYIGEGWRVDIDAIHAFEQDHSGLSSPQSRKSRSRYADTDLGEPKQKKRVPPGWLDSRALSLEENGSTAPDLQQGPPKADKEGDQLMCDAADDRSTLLSHGPDPGDKRESTREILFPKPIERALSQPIKSSLLIRMPNGSVKVNWPHLYRQRRRLEDNWAKGRFTNFQLPHPAHMEESHRECIYAIQFIGKWLVSGSRDRTVRVWDMDTKRLWYRPLIGHTKSVLCLQFDPRPSEDIIISGSSDKNVIIWRFSTGEKLHEIAPAHDDSVLNLRFDHRYLVTCSKDKLIKIWNRHNLSPADKDYPSVHRGCGVTYPMYIVDISEMPSPILEAEIAKNHIRTLAPYSLLMTLDGHTAAVNAIQLTDDEIISASGDRLIKIWNVRNGACKKSLMGHEKGIACVQVDNQRIISGSNDDTVRIFDHSTGAEVASLHGHSNLVRTVQAGFGDPPGSEETLRLEALAVEREFWDAQRSGQAVDLSAAALRRAGYQQNTTGSRNPRDIKALGAHLPPGGGGSKWGRIVSGSYDESIIIWTKDKEGHWVVSQKLRQAVAAANASNISARPGATLGNAFAQLPIPLSVPPQLSPSTALNQQGNSSTTAQQPTTNQPPPTLSQGEGPHNRLNPTTRPILATLRAASQHVQHALPRIAAPTPTARIFKIQFDARKIVCSSQDPRIVGWDFVCDDEELDEASQFFTSL
ncbi:WD40-repeat-containing domain protein [Aspergillus cavernicola]|uniref:Probable E3 ubiquitin ligase complex SCF subunit sconB n=1 Tax=Aspergillus cavernicola TaxID=176166 RepID=A0ABR4I9I5_9EURO